MAKEGDKSHEALLQDVIDAASANPTSVIGGPTLRYGLVYTRATAGRVTADARSVLSTLAETQPTVYRRVDATLRLARNLVFQQVRPNGSG